MFQVDELGLRPNQRAHLVETLLSLGHVKRITIEFLREYCNHSSNSSKPSQVYWREIPIFRLKCEGKECDLRIQNNTQNVVFFLLKNIIQLPSVRFVSLLIDLRLPSWEKTNEFAVIVNRIGKMLIIPTSQNLSSLVIKKLLKHINIQVTKKILRENDLELIDIILPESLPLSDFKIRL